MNKYLILIILVIIIYFNKNIFECFLPNNYDDDYIQFNETSPSNNCCLVEKQFVYSPTFQNKGKFTYVYKKINYPKYCKNNLHNLKLNKSNLFIEGDILYLDDDNNQNNIIWNNKMCYENNSPLGSCRFANKECIEFIDQDSCNKLNMEWSEKTCQDKLPFKFKDNIIFKIPEPKLELIQMFPS
jgi:hypothetical protein